MKIIKEVIINNSVWGLGDDGDLYWKKTYSSFWSNAHDDYPSIGFMKEIVKAFGELLVWL
jgi:hypothetical protein